MQINYGWLTDSEGQQILMAVTRLLTSQQLKIGFVWIKNMFNLQGFSLYPVWPL
jgi:hypothetical protein